MSFSAWMWMWMGLVVVVVALLSGLHWKALDLVLDGFGTGAGEPDAEPPEPATIVRR